MDTSDVKISFDKNGECDHCQNFKTNIVPEWNYGENRLDKLLEISKKMKDKNKDKDFDCIIGLSGGLDSSYTAYIAKEIMGLRPLLLHVDAGWNTDQAVENIEKLVDGLKLDLYTEVINWEEMKDLQVAFLKSQIPDQDIPQDTAFFSALYKFAHEHKIKYVLTGGNYSTEACKEPQEWGAFPGTDETLIKDIHKNFGERELNTFPIIDIFKYKLYYRYILGMQVIKPLNYVKYEKIEAEQLLYDKFGWKKFQHKHHESRFTRFYEDYWLPNKHGYEKRRAHFSSLIMSGQISRDKALDRISTPELSKDFLDKEFEYIANKLDLSTEELKDIFNNQNKTFNDYKNKIFLIDLGAKIMRKLGLEKRLFR